MPRVHDRRAPARPRDHAGDPAALRRTGDGRIGDRGVARREPRLHRAHPQGHEDRGQRRRRDLQVAPDGSRLPAPVHGRPLRGGGREAWPLLARLLRCARGRRAVGRGACRVDVPPHRGPDLRRHHAGREPEGEVPAGAPPTARSEGPQAGLPLGSHDRRRRRAGGRGADHEDHAALDRRDLRVSRRCASAPAKGRARDGGRRARAGPRVFREGDGIPPPAIPNDPFLDTTIDHLFVERVVAAGPLDP